MKRPSHLQVVPDSSNPSSKTASSGQTAAETKRLLDLLKSKDQEILQLKSNLDENQNHIQ